MKRIVGIGASVYDTLVTLPCYPPEDTKLRALAVKPCGGGPCATGLTAAAKLGAPAAYLGQAADDAAGRFLLGDFRRFGVSTELVSVVPGCRSFSSFIWLSEETGSRTCVFDKGDLPPLTLTAAQKDAVRGAALLLLDGNELDAAVEAARLARENGVPVLLDAGGLYEGIDRLLPLADLLIPSEEFALAVTGAADAEQAAALLWERYAPRAVAVTCGKEGGVLCENGSTERYPSFPVRTADSNGAGDVFHGAFAFAAVRGMSPRQACRFASAVSAVKCTRVGAREGSPALAEVTAFLKERGIDESQEKLE